jgi:hypothetical protein
MYVYVSKEFLSLNDMEVLFLVQGAWCMVHGSFGCRTFFCKGLVGLQQEKTD